MSTWQCMEWITGGILAAYVVSLWGWAHECARRLDRHERYLTAVNEEQDALRDLLVALRTRISEQEGSRHAPQDSTFSRN